MYGYRGRPGGYKEVRRQEGKTVRRRRPVTLRYVRQQGQEGPHCGYRTRAGGKTEQGGGGVRTAWEVGQADSGKSR